MCQTVFLKNSILVLIIIVSGCSGKPEKMHLPYYNTPDFTPVFLSNEKDVVEKINHIIQPFSFSDQSGKQITEKDIDGKIHVANFFFTRCGSICPVMTEHIKLVQREFKDNQDIVILSYSVTPWVDSVPDLERYAVRNGVNSSNWHFLTGNKAEIYKLARQSYYAEEDLGFTKDSTDFLHTEHVLLIDKSRRIRGIYNGTLQLEIEQLIKDIKLLESGS